MPARIDLAGQRFDRLLVISFSHIDKRGFACWLCHCDCGVEKPVRGTHLTDSWRSVRSCGCAKVGPPLTPERHGHACRGKRSPEHQAWSDMKRRCYNPKDRRFKDYGARGISVCDEWRNSFEAFLAHIGPRPSPEHSLDRIDNDGNYEPGNVRWATREQQQRNRRDR